MRCLLVTLALLLLLTALLLLAGAVWLGDRWVL
jgi:hypothetical protein